MSETDSTLPPAASAPEPVAPATPPKKKGAARLVTPILALVAALVVGGVAGVLIGQNTAGSANAATQGQRGGFGGYGGPGTGQAGAGGGGITAGTITAIDGDTITVKLTSGTTITVTASGTTKVTTTTTSSVSDLAVGQTITAVGAKDANGNVTATRISEGAVGGFGGQGGAPDGAPTAPPAG